MKPLPVLVMGCISALSLSCNTNTVIKQYTVRYRYVIEVEVYGPKEIAEEEATVTLSWPNGSKVLSLAGRRNSDAVTIPWRTSYSTNPDVFIDPILFSMSVEVKKSGYAPWYARYIHGDFVKMQNDTMLRVDKVRLYQIPENVRKETIEELSLALPCGLDIYTTRSFTDIDEDGSPEAILYRRSEPSALQSPLAEIRVMSLRSGKWISMFVANHQGVFISGKKVPQSTPAPSGYTFSRLGAGDELLFEQLCPLGEADKARTYIWRKGNASFEVLHLDNSDVDSLIKALKDENVLIRMRAASLLGRSRNKRAIESLIKALADDNPYFLMEVETALEKLTGQKFGTDQTRWMKWLEELVGKLKRITAVPICVGFGISKPEHAAAVASADADGVIIGSKIVGLVENNLDNREKMLAEISTFLSCVRSALEHQVD